MSDKTYNIMCTIMHRDDPDSTMTSFGLLEPGHTKAEASVFQAKLGLKIHELNKGQSSLTQTMLDSLESGKVTFAEIMFMATEGWRNMGSAGRLAKFLIEEHGKGEFFDNIAKIAMEEDDAS